MLTKKLYSLPVSPLGLTFVSRSHYFYNFKGAYQTPQLLELSGIGKKSILDQYEIKSLVDLPVGENLQDHLMVSLNFGLTAEAQGALVILVRPIVLIRVTCHLCSCP